ncbi:MAG TPA: glycosyl transferase, partial [Acidimicrobiales bacterium]|nr:glycosyl transferase [Acidimicrobiales bacterium]
MTGNERGSVGGTGTPGNQWGPTGWTRLFTTEMGGQISWLIPAALLGAVAALWLTRRAPRTDRTRAAVLLFAGWLVLMGATFSFSKGIIHPYYTVALAPPIGALVGIGASLLWSRRRSLFARLVLAGGLVATVAWAFTVLGWSPQWHPELRWALVVVGCLAAVGLLLMARAVPRLLLAALGALGLAAALGAPAAYSLDTAATAHTGAIPSAGPAVAGGLAGPGGFRGFRGFGGFRGPRGFGQFGPGGGTAAPPPFGTGPGGAGAGGTPGLRGSGRLGIGRGSPGAPAGGLLDASKPGRQLVALLEQDANRYRWVAATVGANSAAGYQLATREPVMAIGGFNGTDPTPSLAAFERYVAERRVHYYIA